MYHRSKNVIPGSTLGRCRLVKDRPPQYGGRCYYDLIHENVRVNQLRMSKEDARERNGERKKNGIPDRWWWSGYPVPK